MNTYRSVDDIIKLQLEKLKRIDTFIELLKVKIGNNAEFVEKQQHMKRMKDKINAIRNDIDECNKLCMKGNEILSFLETCEIRINRLNEIMDEKNFEQPTNNEPKNEPKESLDVPPATVGDTYVYSPVELSKPNKKVLERIKFIIYIEPISTEEFEIIPKYMLGRLTLSAINNFIEIINNTVAQKYNLLSKPRSSVKNKEMKLYQEYKRQETNDTKNKQFVLDIDIARYQGKKGLDKGSYAYFPILRHCKRIYEIRSNSLVRYILIS